MSLWTQISKIGTAGKVGQPAMRFHGVSSRWCGVRRHAPAWLPRATRRWPATAVLRTASFKLVLRRGVSGYSHVE